jgi:hypothetical protein
MTTRSKDKLKKLIEILTVISISGGLVYGGVAWGWNKVCIPQVDAKIGIAIEKQVTKQEQNEKMIIETLTNIDRRLSRIEGKLE